MIRLFPGYPNERSLLGKRLEFQGDEREEGWNRDMETGNLWIITTAAFQVGISSFSRKLSGFGHLSLNLSTRDSHLGVVPSGIHEKAGKGAQILIPEIVCTLDKPLEVLWDTWREFYLSPG